MKPEISGEHVVLPMATADGYMQIEAAMLPRYIDYATPFKIRKIDQRASGYFVSISSCFDD